VDLSQSSRKVQEILNRIRLRVIFKSHQRDLQLNRLSRKFLLRVSRYSHLYFSQIIQRAQVTSKKSTSTHLQTSKSWCLIHKFKISETCQERVRTRNKFSKLQRDWPKVKPKRKKISKILHKYFLIRAQEQIESKFR